MKTVKQFWQLLNPDILKLAKSKSGVPALEHSKKEEKLGETVEFGAEASKAMLELSVGLGLLGTPAAPLGALIAGLSFVGVTRTGLKLYNDRKNQDPAEGWLEGWVAVAYPLAYVESFGALVQRNEWLREKITAATSERDAKQQIDQLGELSLDKTHLEKVLTDFPDSHLGLALNRQLSQYLEQVGLERHTIPLVTGWVAWETKAYVDELRSYEPEHRAKQLRLLAAISQEIAATKKYANIETYLKEQISPPASTDSPQQREKWQVFDEPFLISDIYVPLKVQEVDVDRKVETDAPPVELESWAKALLTDATQDGQVIFLQGGPGRGKSVFCRMFADKVRQHLHPIWTPILIRLRDIDSFGRPIEDILRTAVKANFAASDDGWLTDLNTRFLFLLDGFDELRMEGRTSGGLEKFLDQVGRFQETCQGNRQYGHRFLITGRESALQGVIVPKNMKRVEISLMDKQIQAQWLTKWKGLLGENKAEGFRAFLQYQNCPTEVKQLAQEPLLIYLLAAMHRDGGLTSQMFEGSSRTNARILIYQAVIDWVLCRQRDKDLSLHLTEFDTEDLKQVLIEAGLCVTQSGKEWTSIQMIEERLHRERNAKELLEKAQKRIGDNPLRNALAAFYLRPVSDSGVKEGAVEFVHKSFGEFLCAQRLQQSLERWVRIDQESRRQDFLVTENQLFEEIYDLLGYGGLTPEIVSHLMGLLDASEKFQPIPLFKRLKEFYFCWCDGEFIDKTEETIPQKAARQLQRHGIRLGQRSVDVYAGLNVMILLLVLHCYARFKNELKDSITFNPCGGKNTEGFEPGRLLRVIGYSQSIHTLTFTRLVTGFLSGADLSDAKLIGADLSDADLSDAKLIGAKLIGAKLSGADLNSADLTNADLTNADLTNADLSGAALNSADLSDADLMRTNLRGADLRRTNLRRTNLSGADLSGADLSGADLSGANLNSADLIGANLIDADLSGANLIDADLSGADLGRIKWNDFTIWNNVRGLETVINVPENLKAYQLSEAKQIALALANLTLHKPLWHQSIRDLLTGLFNRRYFDKSLEREVNRAERKQQSVGILLIDIDHFKQFNDTFGHHVGDIVLRELGLFLKRQIRGSDIACRYGGEEFTLILPEASLDATMARAEQLREGVKHLNVQHHRQPLGAITISLGAACFPFHGLTGTAMLEAADAALYRAKKEGRDRCCTACIEPI